jgi:hypothetical protein
MNTLKVTFENGHSFLYQGGSDDDLLWEQISNYRGGDRNVVTGYSSGLTYKIEIV